VWRGGRVLSQGRWWWWWWWWWCSWSILGHSDAMAVRAETKSKIAFYGTIASGVQTSPMSTEVNEE
jgi:hypothetical protein